MGFVLESGETLSSSSSTLVLPAISIGNVGQLAVDLIISSTTAARIGYLDDPYVLPCVGNDAYSACPPGKINLPLEVYESSAGITIIQQRSPVIKGSMIDFARNLAEFAISSGKKHVVILSSIDFSRWRNIDTTRQIYYLSSANSDGTDSHCEELGWKRLQDYNPGQKAWKHLSSLGEVEIHERSLQYEDELEEEDYIPSLPFAALFSCFKAKGLNVTCLLSYCSEGDNTGDALQLAEAACGLQGVNSGDDGLKWSIPCSWGTVYGPPPDMAMF